ncbi:hypothetical protein RHGRI_014790 [Rhododendron griersonianum]|uniref:Uncharacterized protein n=1 Tax=Rhododendron griersonianum TaxID=479676 RepID=A0AAV6KAT1_9ERIC|nr:hypothetical protein RHGRI_014790 [Rhododendron griersonianum]
MGDFLDCNLFLRRGKYSSINLTETSCSKKFFVYETSGSFEEILIGKPMRAIFPFPIFTPIKVNRGSFEAIVHELVFIYRHD